VVKAQKGRQLQYTTEAGGPGFNNWFITWKLSEESKVGGYIVQHITFPPYLDYWEAWDVPPHSQYTNQHANKQIFDDYFLPWIHSGTVRAEARFYEGLQLPAAFITPNPNTFAGALPSTTQDPQLPTNNATPPVIREWEAP
jgi:hypothetical protein